MRTRAVFSLMLAATLSGCFPRLAHYEGDPPAVPPRDKTAERPPVPFNPDLAPLPPERVLAFILITNPFLTPDLAKQEAEAICRHAAVKGVPVHLVVSLIATESSFNPRAVSPVGAQGLGQLMPATARDMGVNDPFDVEQNVAGTTRYLAWLASFWKTHPRRWELMLASYLAGVGTVSNQLKAGRDLTNEQSVYVRKILQLSSKV